MIVRFLQDKLNAEVTNPIWIEEDKGYDSEAMRNQIMSRYPASMPSIRASASSSAAAAHSRSTTSADGQHIGRQLQLIHGELSGIATSLRILTDRGGRTSVVAALRKLGNSNADASESGQCHGSTLE